MSISIFLRRETRCIGRRTSFRLSINVKSSEDTKTEKIINIILILLIKGKEISSGIQDN
jgi:hypothetical protein